MRALRIIFLLGVAVSGVLYFGDIRAARGLLLIAFVLSYIVARMIGGKNVPVDPIEPEKIQSLNLAERELESNSRTPAP